MPNPQNKIEEEEKSMKKGGKYETEICNKYIFFRCKASVE